MMSRGWPERINGTVYLLLCGFAVVLPIFETPKNLIAFLLLLAWIASRFVDRNTILRKPNLDLIEGSLLLMIAATVVSTAVNWPFPNGLKGFKDVFLQVLIFWLIYRARFSERQQLRLAEMIALGVFIGIIWGIAEVFQGHRPQLQFHSAGAVSQSAIYLGTALILAFSIASMASESSPSGIAVHRRATLWWTASAIMIVALFLMGSRGPLAASLLTMFTIIILAGRKRLILFTAGLVVLSVSVAGLLPDYFIQKRVFTKSQEMLEGHITLADQERVSLWRIAIKQIKEGNSLIFGIGPRNYAAIDYKNMKFDPPLKPVVTAVYQAHNLFLHKLVEEGVVGLLSLLFFFEVVIARLLMDRREGRWRRWQWLSAIGALAVPISTGLFADPWRQEHGLLAMMLLAIALSPSNARAVASS